MYTKAAIGCFLFLTTISYAAADVSHLASGSVSPGGAANTGAFNQQNWNIRDNIPGEPDVDYPIYSVPPISSFSCKGRHYGYYADVESRCQVFRVCATTDLTGKGFAFLCPNGTLFNQKFFVCDWYKNVDCSASESFFSRNAFFGTKMDLMSENDMMSMVQGMVDYTKQPQFNNQKINNNGGFPFSNSQVPKQLENSQSLINQNNGLTSVGSGSRNNQQQGSSGNQGRANNNAQIPQRGSDILSQPIFPSENNRLTSSTNSQGTSGNAIPNTGSGSEQFNQNGNFNSNNGRSGSNDNNNQQPTLFVSSLGEISSDPSLRLNPFTTAIVSTRTYDALSSNVDPISQKLTSNGQFNQLSDNTQPKVQSTNSGKSFNAGQFQPDSGLNNPITLQQEINHLSVSQSNPPSSTQHQQNQQTQGTNGANKAGFANAPISNDQSGQTLTAVYTGSGDLLSHTIGQYGKADSSDTQDGQNARDPNLSALVNSLGETIYTPVFSGEGNLLSQTIGQRGPSKTDNGGKTQQQPNISATSSKLVVSTPQPSLQTPYYSDQTRVTSAPNLSTHSTGTNVQENGSKINVVYSGEGNLLSQTIGQKGSGGQSQQQLDNTQSSNSNNNEGESIQNNGRKGQQIVSITANRLSGGQTSPTKSATSNFSQGKSRDGSANQVTQIGASSTVTQTTQQIPSVNGQSFGQRLGQKTNQQYNQPLSNSQSNGLNQFNTVGQTTYNNGISFGQKLTTKSVETSTTAVPYSPSIPPFRSTTASIYTPTAISYNQHTQTYNGQSRQSHSYTQHDNAQATFANNQFQVPSKEYLPSADNTRTARTNDLTFGNHAPTLKLSSSQNFARNGGNQQDARQQFTYPVDQTDSKLLDNSNDLPNLGVDADTTKQNLINRDVTHIDKYLHQIEPIKNDTGEPITTTRERNFDIKSSSISIGDIFHLNRILQEEGRFEDTTSEELSPVDANVTEESNSELAEFRRSPIIVAPVSNSLSDDDDDDDNDGSSNDIQDREALQKFDESANLLFAGLQLSLYEERELSNSQIKNELNDDIFKSQDIYETKIRNPKDVYSSGGGLKQSNSIKLIFERAKNRSNDFRVKLKSKKEEENKAKRTFALPPKTAEEKLVTILKPLLKNITITPNRYLENNTKIAGFINNDLKYSIGEPRQRHSLAPRVLFKNVKTIEDIERIATGIDNTDTEDDELTAETKLSNKIAFPDSIKSRTISDTDNEETKMTISSNEPSVEIVNKDKDWSYYTKTMIFPQRNQPRPIRDHETASSNQQNYASTYSASQSQQSNQQAYSSSAYNQYNTYPQYQQPQPQQHQPIHYATIDNRPNPSYSSFQAPPLQSQYPTSIQNNPQSSSYHSVTNRYIPSVPSIPSPIPSSIPSHIPSAIPSHIPSAIPPSLPSIVHPSAQYPTQSTHSFSSNQSPRTTSNEKVVVNIIPATGWYLNDANERQSFLDAVSRGLLSEKGFVYVNDVQGSQRQSNLNSQQTQSTGRSQIDIDEEAYFRGSSSYESPLNSVGKLPGDSDSVSGYFDSTSSGTKSSGYQYEHPRRSFNV